MKSIDYGDLISRADAIYKIRNESRKWGDEYGISDVLCDLNDMPSAQPEPPWIPVSERLPDETGSYLVTVGNHAYPVEEAVFFAKDSYWAYVYTGSRYRDGYILAWMPLPERYRGKQ